MKRGQFWLLSKSNPCFLSTKTNVIYMCIDLYLHLCICVYIHLSVDLSVSLCTCKMVSRHGGLRHTNCMHTSVQQCVQTYTHHAQTCNHSQEADAEHKPLLKWQRARDSVCARTCMRVCACGEKHGDVVPLKLIKFSSHERQRRSRREMRKNA